MAKHLHLNLGLLHLMLQVPHKSHYEKITDCCILLIFFLIFYFLLLTIADFITTYQGLPFSSPQYFFVIMYPLGNQSQKSPTTLTFIYRVKISSAKFIPPWTSFVFFNSGNCFLLCSHTFR